MTFLISHTANDWKAAHILIQVVIEMTIGPVLNDSQLEVVGNLAYEIWNEHFIPIIGNGFIMDDYRMEKVI